MARQRTNLVLAPGAIETQAMMIEAFERSFARPGGRVLPVWLLKQKQSRMGHAKITADAVTACCFEGQTCSIPTPWTRSPLAASGSSRRT
jgi:hypothetical protein